MSKKALHIRTINGYAGGNPSRSKGSKRLLTVVSRTRVTVVDPNSPKAKKVRAILARTKSTWINGFRLNW